MFNSSDQLKGLLLIASVVVIWVLASFLVQNVEQAGSRWHQLAAPVCHQLTPPRPGPVSICKHDDAHADSLTPCRRSASGGPDLRC